MNPKPQPLVKWVGGKRQLADSILPLLFEKADPTKATYFEPFFGGGAILFALQPVRAFASDINAGLVNLYNVAKTDLVELTGQLARLESRYNGLASDHQKEMFLSERHSFNESPRVGVEMAARFVFLNKAGFNGMYRENSRGKFNIPFGNRASLSLATDENLNAVSLALHNVEINLSSYIDTASLANSGDIVYFDPPYVPLSATSSFTGYSAGGFSDSDQLQLRDLALALTDRGVHVVLSNSSAPRVAELYKDFRISSVSASRNVAASASGRARVEEFLITNADLL
jgi:DNA adenine methylase